MRSQVAVVFALLAVCSFATIPTPVMDTGLFTIGFFDGLNKVVGLPAFSPCVALHIETAQEIQGAIKLIATKKPAQVIAGIAQLGEALQNVPNVVAGCKGAEEDVKLLKNAIAVFKNPKIILTELENLLINGAQTDAQIKLAIAAEKAGNWLAFGNAVGQLVGLASTRQPHTGFGAKFLRLGKH